jgi:hypothetical protein
MMAVDGGGTGRRPYGTLYRCDTRTGVFRPLFDVAARKPVRFAPIDGKIAPIVTPRAWHWRLTVTFKPVLWWPADCHHRGACGGQMHLGRRPSTGSDGPSGLWNPITMRHQDRGISPSFGVAARKPVRFAPIGGNIWPTTIHGGAHGTACFSSGDPRRAALTDEVRKNPQSGGRDGGLRLQGQGRRAGS